MNGRSGHDMIDRITVTEDVQTVSYDAQPTDASKTPVFQTLLETTSLVARNTPLGLQFLANFPARNNDINGILGKYVYLKEKKMSLRLIHSLNEDR